MGITRVLVPPESSPLLHDSDESEESKLSGDEGEIEANDQLQVPPLLKGTNTPTQQMVMAPTKPSLSMGTT